jgi:hypothetical protein
MPIEDIYRRRERRPTAEDYADQAAAERRAFGFSHLDEVDEPDLATIRGLGARGPEDFANDHDPENLGLFLMSEFAAGDRRVVAMFHHPVEIIETAKRLVQRRGRPYDITNREELYRDIEAELDKPRDPRNEPGFIGEIAAEQDRFMDADIKAQIAQAKLLRAIGKVPGI